MGDVENTILKHFEKEKNDFRSESDPYFGYFFFFKSIFPNYQNQNHYENSNYSKYLQNTSFC